MDRSTTAAPIRPRVFHIVSPLTGSKATIITTDTTTPDTVPVLIQSSHRVRQTALSEKNQYVAAVTSRKRAFPYHDVNETIYQSHRRTRERLTKGLRHFSKKVCNKVQEKVVTTYNEVATELVNEHSVEEGRHIMDDDLAYEQKNIRRRVYDAINVLMAMNIISKDKKDIRWIGFPVNALFECEVLDNKINAVKQSIREKVRLVEESLLKEAALRKLVKRNSERSSTQSLNSVCYLPFLGFTTSNGTQIESIISEDGRDVFLSFDRKFEIIDDTDCLHRLGLTDELRGRTSDMAELEKTRLLLPETFHDFVTEMCLAGKLRPLYERSNTSSNTKRPQSHTQQQIIKSSPLKPTMEPQLPPPLIFVPPSCFDEAMFKDDEQEEEYIVDDEEDDDVLSLSSEEEIDNEQQQESESSFSKTNRVEPDTHTLITAKT